MIYNTYKRLTSLFHFEYKTSFNMRHRLDQKTFIDVDLYGYKKERGYPKLYDKSVNVYRWYENLDNPKNSGNMLIFSTKDFSILKNWLIQNNYL